jgi:hypothetical protein
VVAGSGDYTAAQVTGALQASNNLSDVASAGSSRANIHIPVLTPAAAVATSNVSSLSGLPTIDGYSLASGDLVLLTAQSTASQNGLWSPASGAWTRPAEFASGATITGRTIEIQNGTSYGGTSWTLATATAGVVIDTGAQSWSITQQTYNDARYGSVITITRQTAAYVFALSDAGTVVESTDASPCTFTIPQSVFPLNTILGARQTTAAGQITLAAAAGVTIDEPGGRYHTNQQWSTIWAHQRNLNEWVLSGDLG